MDKLPDNYSWTQDKWRDFFAKKGVTTNTFHGTVFQRAREGADYFAEAGFHNYTTADLTALVDIDRIDGDPLTLKHIANTFGTEIARHYRKEYKNITIKTGLSFTHFLRIEAGSYQGNLLECMGYAPNANEKVVTPVRDQLYAVRGSHTDWREGVTLPTNYGFDEARLFGMIWSASVIQKKPVSYEIQFSVPDTHRAILFGNTANLFEEVFSLTPSEKFSP